MSRRLIACLVAILIALVFFQVALAQDDDSPPPPPGGYANDPAPPPAVDGEPFDDEGDGGYVDGDYDEPVDDIGDFSEDMDGDVSGGYSDDRGEDVPDEPGYAPGDRSPGGNTDRSPRSRQPGDSNGSSTGQPAGDSGSQPLAEDEEENVNKSIPDLPKSTSNWGMAGLDLINSGRVHDRLELPLKLGWKYVTGDQSEYVTEPVVVDGVVYFSVGKRFYAIDAETGSLYWKYPEESNLESAVTTTALVGEDLVYFGAGDGKFYALRKEDGILAWNFAAKGAITSHPMIADGSLYFGSNDNVLYSVNPATGQPKWPGGFRTRDDIVGRPAFAGGYVYFMSNEMVLYCAVADSGKIKWWQRTSGTATKATSPVLADNLVFLATGNMFQAFQNQNGYVRWSFTLASNMVTVPVLKDSVLYYACQDGKLWAVTTSGKARWKQPTDLGIVPMGRPVIADDTLIVAGGRGYFVAVDLETGAIKWKFMMLPTILDEGKYEYTNVVSPLVVNKGTLYAITDDGVLASLRSDMPDTTPPLVSTVVPSRGSLTPGNISLLFGAKVADEGSGINWDTLSLTLDGKPLEITKNPEKGVFYFKRKIEKEAVIQPLPDGPHVVTIIVSDWAGNKQETSWGFTVDNRLVVKPDAEEENIRNASGVRDVNRRGSRTNRNRGGMGGPGGMVGPGGGMMGGY